MKVGTLFSGVGGMTLGAVQAGFEPVWAIEREKVPAQIYRANIGEVIEADVAEVEATTLESVDLLLASPPCQNASTIRYLNARTGEVLEPHSDADAGFEIIRFLKALRPRWFILENVPNYRKEPAFKAICESLTRMKYSHIAHFLNAADYGVPMCRKRLFLLASRERDLIQLPPQVSAWSGWWEGVCDIWGDEPCRDLPLWLRDYAGEAEESLLIDSKRNRRADGSHYVTTRTLSETSFCLVRAHGNRPAYARVGGAVKAVSARMWAALMMFPSDFLLTGRNRAMIGEIGNAVPPRLAEQLCRSFA